MYVGEPIHENEPDLLIGHERECLVFKDQDGEIIDVYNSPKSGWTHVSKQRTYKFIARIILIISIYCILWG